MRQNILLRERDRAIVKKFHELHDVNRVRMDDVLNDLSKNHFFLSPDYIYSIIFYNKDNNAYYGELVKGMSRVQPRLKKRAVMQ